MSFLGIVGAVCLYAIYYCWAAFSPCDRGLKASVVWDAERKRWVDV